MFCFFLVIHGFGALKVFSFVCFFLSRERKGVVLCRVLTVRSLETERITRIPSPPHYDCYSVLAPRLHGNDAPRCHGNQAPHRLGDVESNRQVSLVAIGSSAGHLRVISLELDDDSAGMSLGDEAEQRLYDGKICSIHWLPQPADLRPDPVFSNDLRRDLILSTGPNGVVVTIDYCFSNNLNLVPRIVLEESNIC